MIVNPVKERFGIQLTSVDHYSSAKLPVDCHLVDVAGVKITCIKWGV